MPIWLRKFTYSKLKEYLNPTTTENVVEKSRDAMRRGATDSPVSQINVPTYVTKANKVSPKK
jgi:hypothetical protein